MDRGDQAERGQTGLVVFFELLATRSLLLGDKAEVRLTEFRAQLNRMGHNLHSEYLDDGSECLYQLVMINLLDEV